MKTSHYKTYAARFVFVASALAVVWLGLANSYTIPVSNYYFGWPEEDPDATADTGGTAADSLIWPNEDFQNPQEEADGISIPLPDNIQYSVEYNAETGLYEVVQTIGDSLSFRNGTTMTLEEYLNSDMEDNIYEYWNEIQEEEDAAEKDFAPYIKIDSEGFKKIFGGDQIEIRPQGSAEITFGLNISKTDNPRIPEKQRRITTFDFDQKIQLNVVGKIGTAMELNVNYNTESTFEFENQMKLQYTGDEDQIIQKIELGNVQLPLKGTLIQGSQSLFGMKLETRWGRLRNTTVFSQQKGERKEIDVQGGAQTQRFDLTADNYEANRHYFLSGWFRGQYDNAMKSLPLVNSGVNITRIEVWVVNTQANTQDVRNVIGFTDIGEHSDYMSSNLPIGILTDSGDLAVTLQHNPSNLNNELYLDCINTPEIMNFTGANAAIAALPYGLDQGIHYERVGNARKLNPSEYSYNTRLGFISLKQSLNNAEVLGVSYEYTLGGETFQVGTLSQDGFTAPQALILKLLKSSITQVKLDNGDPAPLWDNMMKNVYSLGSFGINPENFRLDVWWNNPATGTDMNYIPREPINGKQLLQVLNLDRLDINTMPYPDGVFDFVPNATTQGGLIDAQAGKVFFPNVEPFGQHLADVISAGIPDPAEAAAVIAQIVFQPLYDSTKTAAQQIPQLNRFKIKGQFQSASSSEISLNALNIPQGSVTVTAGGIQLVESVDYTVDYNLGRVRIINEGVMESGQPIKVSLESNSMFNLQYKTLIGSRFDYEVNDYLNIGGTVLNLRERPITQKVNVGDEPVNNTVLGLDVNFQKEAPFLTRLVDALPFIESSQKSNIDLSGEIATLFPGHSRAISKDGNAYVDDFEGSQSTIDLRTFSQWFLASTPKGQTENAMFPEGALECSREYNYNRAKLAWYVIDPTVFFNESGITPDNVNADMRSEHCMREVLEGEVFPNRELTPGTPPNIATLDMSYYPDERGMYNYDEPAGTSVSSGLSLTGRLNEPDTRWGGIQRALTTTDFEASNIEYIQIWMMDPFNADSDNNTGGDLYFNLGNISEDIINESALSFENGYPVNDSGDPPVESICDPNLGMGFYPNPNTFNVVNAFDNSTGSYAVQDIGIDGMNSAAEEDYFIDWLADVNAAVNDSAYTAISSDPSADDFMYFRGSEQDAADLDVLERYKKYNGYDGNSNTTTPDNFPITATTIPNTEDINQDLTLNTIESYYQYKVSLRPGDLGENNIGKNYITDSFETTVTTDNGEERTIRWYQFKIPVRDFEKAVNGIADFRSIRYLRMYMKGWSEPVCLRFARLELVRGEWRKYLQSLEGPQELENTDDPETTFNIAAVNIEENGNRDPIPYVVPPGIIREQDVGSSNLRNLNEQSLSLEVCNLKDGDARAAYRNVNFDMRQYKRLRMYVHAEALGVESALTDKDVTCFIRLGSDFNENYYEYEIPLYVTPWYSGDDDEIWPEENNFDIELKKLQDLKINRPPDWNTQLEFETVDGNARISVKGNPNLSDVVTIMIGIRNPDQDGNVFESNDDGGDECAIVWVNELRLSEFDEKGGWAAVARMNATLADFGTFAVAGNISKPGWGTLEQRVQERQQSTKMGFDANSTLQMGKFFPENWGVQLPVYMGFSESVEQPRYSPLQPDIEMSDIPNINKPLKKKSQDFTKRRSINVSNFRISPKAGGGAGGEKPGEGKDPGGRDEKAGDPKDEKGGGTADKGGAGGGGKEKSHFYDVSNFSLSYSYNEEYRSNIDLDWRLNRRYKGGLDYMFANKPKEIKPFAKVGFVKSAKALKWVKEFNFYMPWSFKSFGFNTNMDRMYETSRIRNNTLELFGVYSDMLITTQVLKTWNWTRAYTFKYDITKSLKFDYSANNLALVEEPQGIIDRENSDYHQAYRDTVMGNIQNWGTTTNYNHNASLNYKLPFDKFPIIDFLSSDARYAATYRWDHSPFTQDSIGHTIQNSRNVQLNAQANFETLYNKVPLLKQINSGKPKKDDKKKEKDDPTTKDGFGEDEKPKKDRTEINPLHVTLRFLMMLRNVNGSYTRNEGILLPGYARTTRMVGMDENFEAPGWGFVFGQQNTDVWGNETGNNYALDAARSGYLVNQPNLNQLYTETFSETWNYKIQLEPIKSLKIELTANKQQARNESSFFRFDDDVQDYVFDSPQETGNITASIISWPTAFVKDEPDNGWTSATFENFLLYRLETSAAMNAQTYNDETPLPNGFYTGWGPTSQDVVIPAFIAAYTGKTPNEVSLDPFGTKVQPNWKVTYDGLTKIPSIKKYFKQFNITHNYKSTLTTSYIRNLNFTENEEGLPTALDQSEHQNWIPERQISTVTISEQLTPLGLDMTIKTGKNNDPQLKVEYKRERTVSLGLTNYQITETKSNSVIFGVGYKLTEVPNPFGRGKGSKLPIKLLDKTTVTFKVDVTMRDNVTIVRKMVEHTNQPTAGQKLWNIKTSADMAVSDKLTLRFFYDHQITRPKISTSFPTSNINTGISLRFSLNG